MDIDARGSTGADCWIRRSLADIGIIAKQPVQCVGLSNRVTERAVESVPSEKIQPRQKL
jgi:hypothetical protein